MKYVVGLLLLFSTLPAYPASAAAPKQTGWLDVADCSGISGWAWDSTQTSSRLQIDLYDGSIHGQPFATVTAANYRRDLQQVGIGDGAYGFYLTTPASLKDGRTHAIVAAISGTDTAIQIGVNTLSCPADATGYRYYLSDKLSTISTDNWAIKGDAASASGSTLISRLAVPDGSSEYEVRAALNLKESGGVYSIYLHASPDAMAGPAAAGSFYAVELQNPVFTDKGCTATLAISKRSSESVTSLHSETVACHDGMVLRAVSGADGHIGVWLDHWNLTMVDDAEVAAGQPGVGVRSAPAGNSWAAVDLGQLDRLAPGPLSPGRCSGQSIRTQHRADMAAHHRRSRRHRHGNLHHFARRPGDREGLSRESDLRGSKSAARCSLHVRDRGLRHAPEPHQHVRDGGNARERRSRNEIAVPQRIARRSS